MIEVNLIPDVKQELLKAQKARRFVIAISIFVGVGMVAVVGILASYTFGVQSIQSANLDNNIEEQSKKIKEVEDLSKVLTIQNQLSKISDIHANKNINSRVFQMLYAINPTENNAVKYTTVTYNTTDDNREMRIEGQTSNFPALEIFRKTVENANVRWIAEGEGEKYTPLVVTKVNIPETSYGIDTSDAIVLRFVMTFEYAKELLLPSSNNASISILRSENVTNVTDSYEGVPRSLFVDKAKDAN